MGERWSCNKPILPHIPFARLINIIIEHRALRIVVGDAVIQKSQ